MKYSKEELLTIGNFFEIPNIDKRKTKSQLKLIIEKWIIMGEERGRLTYLDYIISNEIGIKFDEKEFIQLARENMHLSLDLKLEKFSYFLVGKLVEVFDQNYHNHKDIWRELPSHLSLSTFVYLYSSKICKEQLERCLNDPNFVKIIVWGMKEIFYKSNFDVVSFICNLVDILFSCSCRDACRRLSIVSSC